MPLWTPSAGYSFRVDNLPASPSTTPGTSIVPGASNAEGSYTLLLSALAQEVHGIYVWVTNGAVSTAARNHLLDIGVDPAGGSSYTAVISNIVCGEAGPNIGQHFYFPIRIPAGATVAARIQGSNATAGTVRVAIRAFGQPDSPWMFPVGQYSETLGTITNSNGTSFTPGNAVDGTWVSLGTSTRALWWFQGCYQLDNGTITADRTYIEFAAGDATNKRILQRLQHLGSTAEDCNLLYLEKLCWPGGYARIPAGTEFWVRGRCIDAPDTGYNAVLVGIGG